MRMITHSYDTYDEAVRAVNTLEAAGIPHDDISLVSGDKDRAVATTVTGDTTGTGTGATIGTVLGGGAGLLAGIGALAIPGVGPVVAAGWLIATLTGAGVGAAAGGLVGSLANSGVDEADATRYAEHVGRGGTLVTVRASDENAANAEYILEHGKVGPMAGTSATMMPASGMGVGMADATLMGAAAMPVASPSEVRLQEDRRPLNRPLTGSAADGFRDRLVRPGDSSATPLRDNAATRAVDRTLDTNISGENPKV